MGSGMTSHGLTAGARASLERYFTSGRYGDLIDQAQRDAIVSPSDEYLWKAWGSAAWVLGDPPGAIKGLMRSLQVNPLDQDACVNLGVALHGVGRSAAATDSYRRAIILGTESPSSYYNFAITFSELGDFEASTRNFLRCAQLDPCDPHIWSGLANVYKIQGLIDSAIRAHQKAICVAPASKKSLSDLGLVIGKIDTELSQHLHAWALRLAGDDPIYLRNYAFTLTQVGALVQAVAELHRAVSIKPDCNSSWMGLAVTMRDMRRSAEALHMIDRALVLQPLSAPKIDCRGTILSGAGEVLHGAECHKMAVCLSPDFFEGLTNLANLFLEIGSVDNAILNYDRASRLSPNDPSPLWNASLAHLSRGDFRAGWLLHESRFAAEAVNTERLPNIPNYTAELHQFVSVLVTSEQGIGDEIMFGSLLRDFRACVGSLAIQVDPRLAPLFRRSFSGTAEIKEKGRYDPRFLPSAQIPLGTIGMHLRNRPEDFQGKNGGYLLADQHRASTYRALLAARGRAPTIGISWRTSNQNSAWKRNIDLPTIIDVLAEFFPTARLVNLQYGDVQGEIVDPKVSRPDVLWRCPQLDLTNDLDGVAALISACDAVLTIGNTTAHIAGALGKPAAVILPLAASWRWMAEGHTTPWYSSLRLFRKRTLDQPWRTTVQEAAEYLAVTLHGGGAITAREP